MTEQSARADLGDSFVAGGGVFEAPPLFHAGIWSPGLPADRPDTGLLRSGTSRPEKSGLAGDVAILSDLLNIRAGHDAGFLESDGVTLATELIEEGLARSLAPAERNTPAERATPAERPTTTLLRGDAAALFDSAELALKGRIASGMRRLVPQNDITAVGPSGRRIGAIFKAGDREIKYMTGLERLRTGLPSAEFLALASSLAEDARAVSIAAGLAHARDYAAELSEQAQGLRGNAKDRFLLQNDPDARAALSAIAAIRLMDPNYGEYDAKNIRASLTDIQQKITSAEDRLNVGDIAGAAGLLSDDIAQRLSRTAEAAGLHAATDSAQRFQASILAVVIAGAAAQAAMLAATPSLIALFGASTTAGRVGIAAGQLFVESAAFVAAHEAVGGILTGETIYSGDRTLWENAGEYGKEVLFTMGMFKAIHMARMGAEKVVHRELRLAAEKRLVRLGKIEAKGIKGEKAEELIKDEVSRMYAARGLGKAGVFTTEAAAFQMWSYTRAQIERHVFGADTDPDAAFTPEGIEDGVVFLAALKLGGMLARPIMMPSTERARARIEKALGKDLAGLQRRFNAAMGRLLAEKDTAADDAIEEFQAIARERRGLIRIMASMGLAPPSEVAQADMAAKAAEALSRALQSKNAVEGPPSAAGVTPFAGPAATEPVIATESASHRAMIESWPAEMRAAFDTAQRARIEGRKFSCPMFEDDTAPGARAARWNEARAGFDVMARELGDRLPELSAQVATWPEEYQLKLFDALAKSQKYPGMVAGGLEVPTGTRRRSFVNLLKEIEATTAWIRSFDAEVRQGSGWRRVIATTADVAQFEGEFVAKRIGYTEVPVKLHVEETILYKLEGGRAVVRMSNAAMEKAQAWARRQSQGLSFETHGFFIGWTDQADGKTIYTIDGFVPQPNINADAWLLRSLVGTPSFFSAQDFYRPHIVDAILATTPIESSTAGVKGQWITPVGLPAGSEPFPWHSHPDKNTVHADRPSPSDLRGTPSGPRFLWTPKGGMLLYMSHNQSLGTPEGWAAARAHDLEAQGFFQTIAAAEGASAIPAAPFSGALDDLWSALRWADPIGPVSADDLYAQPSTSEHNREVGLVGFPQQDGVWRGREGDVMGVHILDEHAPWLLVHTHPPALSRSDPTLAKPSSADVDSAREFNTTGAVVSADGVYIFNETSSSRDGGWNKDRRVGNMILIPTRRVNLINDAGRLLIEPIEGDAIPVRFIDEPEGQDRSLPAH